MPVWAVGASASRLPFRTKRNSFPSLLHMGANKDLHPIILGYQKDGAKPFQNKPINHLSGETNGDIFRCQAAITDVISNGSNTAEAALKMDRWRH